MDEPVPIIIIKILKPLKVHQKTGGAFKKEVEKKTIMNTLSAEAFLKPRLEALVAEAEKAGFAQDVTIALLISLLDTDNFAPASDTAQGDKA
jgi:hypothetical protein